MAANITILYMGEHLDIALERDGSFDITNRDVEQEQMLKFMTGQPSAATTVWDAIASDLLDSVIALAYNYNVVCEMFGISFTIGFMIDCLEHVAETAPSLEGQVRKFIEIARGLNSRFEYGVQAREPLDAVLLPSRALIPSDTRAESEILRKIRSAYREVYLIIIAEVVRDITMMERLHITISSTANARAYFLGPNSKSESWKSGLDLEHAWQARRLIHLIEAKQHHSPRPAVEETR